MRRRRQREDIIAATVRIADRPEHRQCGGRRYRHCSAGQRRRHHAADGQWHTIAQTVTMNTPGTADGTVVVHYDGAQVANFTGITFRAAGDTDAIDSLMFCTFYGGSDSTWAPTATTSADFRGFTVG